MYPMFKQEAAKKAGQLQGMLIVRVNTVLYGVNLCRIKFTWISLGFLSVKIYMHGV